MTMSCCRSTHTRNCRGSHVALIEEKEELLFGVDKVDFDFVSAAVLLVVHAKGVAAVSPTFDPSDASYGQLPVALVAVVVGL